MLLKLQWSIRDTFYEFLNLCFTLMEEMLKYIPALKSSKTSVS